MGISGKRILITGATGFIAHHVAPVLRNRYGDCVSAVSRRDYDLMDEAQVKRMFDEVRPALVVHLAGYSAGVGGNREFPADFYYRNTLLSAMVFEHAARSGVEKILYPIGSCSYPATARSPIGEDQMWEGRPHPDTEAYSATKRMALVAAAAYLKQYGLRISVLTLGNLYGEYDNFDPRDAHVIPAMLRRFYEARLQESPRVVLWGTGKPVRDFVYVGDIAALIPWFLENYDEVGPINVSSGASISILELAGLVRDITGFRGELAWDTSKGDGQLVKVYDARKLQSHGLQCPTTLREGLALTFRWLEQNYASRGEGIRL